MARFNADGDESQSYVTTVIFVAVKNELTGETRPSSR
jgi:hypothetical protein